MTARTERIESAIRRFQKELRLDDWDIRYDPSWDGKKHADATAITNPHRAARCAVIRIDPTISGDNLDWHVAHEMMHLALSDAERLLGNVLAKLGKVGRGVLDTWNEEIERLCNRIAHALTGVVFIPVDEDSCKVFAPWDIRGSEEKAA